MNKEQYIEGLESEVERLKAENNSLKSEKEGWKMRFNDSGERNKKLSKKNAYLKKRLEEYKKPIDKFINAREVQAVKDFAEKLKQRLAKFIWRHNIPECMFNDVMADLLKETNETYNT